MCGRMCETTSPGAVLVSITHRCERRKISIGQDAASGHVSAGKPMGRHIAIGLSTYPQTHCMPGRRHQVLWTRYIDWLRLSPILVLPEVDPAPPRRKWTSAHLSGAGG